MQPNNPISPVISQPASSAPAPAAPSEYISNPFLNSVRELVQMLKVNPVSVMLSGLVGLIVVIIFFIGQGILKAVANTGNTSSIIVVGLVSAFVLLVGFLVLCGSYNIIAGRSLRNEVVSVGESYRVASKRIVNYTVLFIIYWVLTGLLSILVLLPGIYFATRASLAFFVFYEENLGPWASIKRSFSLTSGHFEEMFAAIIASSLLGGGSGLLSGAISLSPLVGRYHDLKNLKESGAEKPKVHYLNWVLTILALLFVFVYIGIAFLAVRSHSAFNPTNNPRSGFPSSSKFNSSPDIYNTNGTFTN